MGLPRTLRGRLALWYGAVLTLVLVAFSAVVYVVAVVEPDALEGADAEEQAEAHVAGQHLAASLAAALPAALLVAVGGGWALSRRELAPLERIIDVAASLDARDLERRIALEPGVSGEVGALVQALNAMLERLEKSVEGLRRFTADASHELRTPLSILSGNLELALRRPREPAELAATIGGALEDVGKLSALVESLLTLARADGGQLALERRPVDVVAVVAGVADAYAAVAAVRDLRIALTPPPPGGAMARADETWLSRAVANLVDNACKYAPEGSVVVVGVACDAGAVRVDVSDDGPGLAADERARVFERFYRGSDTRGATAGFGLGLPLARDIARGLGGDLVVAPREEGCTFSLTVAAA